MKIESADTIRISGNTPAAKIFRNLSPGTEVMARITERYGKNEALLDISGNKIRAHFQNGVPGNNFLVLVLNEKNSRLFLFTIRSATSRSDFTENLKPFLVLGEQGLRPEASLKISRYLGSAPKSIFELNSLLRTPSAGTAGQGLTTLFNTIMEKSGNPPWLTGLSYYLADITLGHGLLSIIYSLTEENKRDQRRWSNPKKNDEIIEDEINKIAQEVDNINEGKDRENIISAITELLSSVKTGSIELPLFTDDSYTALKCISSDNAWIFQAEFSRTGKIEILAKRNMNSYILDVYVENNEALEILERDTEDISTKTGTLVNFHNLVHIIDKLVAINAYFALNSQFDIKV